MCRVERLRWLACLLAMTFVTTSSSAADSRTGARRVVCMAPAFTEICFALGKGAAVAGVTEYCDFPAEALHLPRVGGFLNPNLEAIIRLSPDLVLLVPEEEELARRLDALGIRNEILPVYSLADIEKAMRAIGGQLGDRAAGDRLADSWRKELGLFALDRQAGNPPRVMVVVGRNPGSLNNVFVASPSTFLGEILALVGGKNIYQGPVRYPSLSLEGIAQADPDVIIELYPGMKLGAKQQADRARDWNLLPGLAAVRNRRVHVLCDSFLAIPGPRATAIARTFRDCLVRRNHP